MRAPYARVAAAPDVKFVLHREGIRVQKNHLSRHDVIHNRVDEELCALCLEA